tara:strand:- start:70 stop:426 length:357 start_codon:yes stop_codon:yes gene_type:complete
VVNDAYLNLFDGHWVLVYAKNTSPFAGSWAETARKFWKVIGRMKTVDGFAPSITVNQVVPVWNDVAERAAVVTEGDSAVHASTCLFFQRSLVEIFVDLVPIEKTDWYGPSCRSLSLMF